MSKRVYEVARELDLSTKEVMGRLNDAGVNVKSHFAVVEDPVYERVFGDGSRSNGSGGPAPNGRSEAMEAETLPYSNLSPPKRSLLLRVLVYVLIAVLVFAVAAGVGATTAIMLRGDLSFPAKEEPGPSGQQGNTPQHQGAVADRSQEKESGVEQEEAASRQDEVEYASKVGDIQSKSVETFLDSHDRLLPYDALTSDDIEEMQANQATLQGFTDQVNNLNPPQKYREQYEMFRLGVSELHEAAQLAYTLAADPTAATQATFDEYDRHVNQAAAYLKKSDALLGRDYKTIEGVQRVSPV
jgi:hypothetical protein